MKKFILFCCFVFISAMLGLVFLIQSATAQVSSDFVIDNGQPGTSKIGSWCVSSALNPYGTNSLYSCGSGTDTYTWSAQNIPTDSYEVFVWWTAHSKRSTNVSIEIMDANGAITTKYVNQQIDGGKWNSMGIYKMTSLGNGSRVRVSDKNGQASADAVKFVKATAYPPEIKVCGSNCANLPIPVFKVCPLNNPTCNPISESVVEIYLDNNPLLTFEIFPRVLALNSLTKDRYTTDYRISLIDGKGAVTIRDSGEFAKYTFNGAHRFKILQDPIVLPAGNTFVDLGFAEEDVFPQKGLKIAYQRFVQKNSLGLTEFYKKDSLPVDAQKVFAKTEEVTRKIDTVTGKNHVPYTIYIMPDLLSHLWGGEGNFYFGNGKINMSYSRAYTATCLDECAVLSRVSNEISHEYTHAIQFEQGPFNQSISNSILGNQNSLIEGLADATSVHAKYVDPSKLSSGSENADGCPVELIQQTGLPHTVGRCIFKHLYADGLFSDTFFAKIFNPNHKYNFDSTDVSKKETCDSYLVLFSEAAGTDLVGVLKNKIMGNCSNSLSEAKLNLGFSAGSGPVAHFKFDEGSGTTTLDSSGNGNNGTLANDPLWVTGKSGRALQFDKIDDVVNVNAPTAFDNLPQVTVTAWINPKSAGEGAFGRIIEKADGVTNPTTRGWNLFMTGTNQLTFTADFTSVNLDKRSSANALTLNQWQHVAVTWDGSSANTGAHLYVNGNEVSYTTNQSGSGTRVLDDIEELRIGNNESGTRTFDGAIDEVKIFNQALTLEEIRQIATAQTTQRVLSRQELAAGIITNLEKILEILQKMLGQVK